MDAGVSMRRASCPEVSRSKEEVLGRGQTGRRGEVQHTGGVWKNCGHSGVVEEINIVCQCLSSTCGVAVTLVGTGTCFNPELE